MNINWSIKFEDLMIEEKLEVGNIYQLEPNKCPTLPLGIPVPITKNNIEIGICEIIMNDNTHEKSIHIISLINT